MQSVHDFAFAPRNDIDEINVSISDRSRTSSSGSSRLPVFACIPEGELDCDDSATESAFL